MNARRSVTVSTTAIYLIAIAVIVVAFLLLGGGPWLRGLFHGHSSLSTANWNWAQILISLGLGFLLGVLVGRRRW